MVACRVWVGRPGKGPKPTQEMHSELEATLPLRLCMPSWPWVGIGMLQGSTYQDVKVNYRLHACLGLSESSACCGEKVIGEQKLAVCGGE